MVEFIVTVIVIAFVIYYNIKDINIKDIIKDSNQDSEWDEEDSEWDEEDSEWDEEDSDWIQEEIEGRTESQAAVIRYFYGEPEGPENKLITDKEYDGMIEDVLSKYNFKQMALDKIGLDEDELKEIDPVNFEGFLHDTDSLSKEGEDGIWRSTKYQVSWLFFSTNQVFLYQYTFNMDEDGISETTDEFFYRDITYFSTVSDTVETSIYDSETGEDEIVDIDSYRFAITVPGEKFYCSLEKAAYTEKAINGMKSLLRDKKNYG